MAMTRAHQAGLIHRLSVVVALALLAPGWALAQSIFTHVHLRVPEAQQAEAARWYQRVLGGEPGELGPGPGIRFANGFVGTFPNKGMAGDAAGSVLDHVGIWVADLDAAIGLVQELGGEVRRGPHASAAAPRVAHVTDPWGGRFTLLEDPVQRGIHHAHLYASDADATRDWFLQVFGGAYEPDRGAGRLHAIRYGEMWIQITQAAEGDERAPSRFRALDHIGFRVASLDAFREVLRASGYEPYLERPNPPGADLMFLEGPDGIHIEMTEPER